MFRLSIFDTLIPICKLPKSTGQSLPRSSASEHAYVV